MYLYLSVPNSTSSNPAAVLMLEELGHLLAQGLWNVVLLQVAPQQTKLGVPGTTAMAVSGKPDQSGALQGGAVNR